MKKNIIALIFTTIFISLNGYSQTADLPPIQLDRPDFTETPYLTPKGYLQVENGFSYNNQNDFFNLFSFNTLIKYGINNKFELRLIGALDYINKSIFHSDKTFAIPPIMIGIKTTLLEEKGLIPKTSFLGHLGIGKIATTDLQTDNINPNCVLLMQHTLSKRQSLSYNLGLDWDYITLNPTKFYTIATGYDITKLFGCYIELYGNKSANSKFYHFADADFTFLINNNSMADISAGIGITEGNFSSSRSYFFSCGYSFRFNSVKTTPSFYIK